MAERLNTYGDLQKVCNNRLNDLHGISTGLLDSADLTCKEDLDLGRELATDLREAMNARHADYEIFSPQINNQRWYTTHHMEQFRTAEAARKKEVEASWIEFRMAALTLEDSVYSQRKIEKEGCQRLALASVTAQHRIILEAVTQELSRALTTYSFLEYCNGIAKIVEKEEAHLPLPPELKSNVKYFATVRSSIIRLEGSQRRGDPSWRAKLGLRWKELWQISNTVREEGATNKELKMLWILTMRRAPLPESLAELRTWIEKAKSDSKEKAAASELRSALNKARKDSAKPELDSKYSPKMLKAINIMSRHSSKRVQTLGIHEKFLESAFNILDFTNYDAAASRHTGTPSNPSETLISHQKRWKVVDALAQGDSMEDMEKLTTHTALTVMNAEAFLDAYYEKFGERETRDMQKQLGDVKKGEAVHWSSLFNDVRVLEMKILLVEKSEICVMEKEAETELPEPEPVD